jgi:phosphoribosylformylglycinamidine cyclo-ligase
MSRDRYRLAGVDVAASDEAVARMRAAVEGTFGPEVIGGFGGFSAATVLPPGFRDPVLILAADGVGTKAALAAELGRSGGLGQDLVAMCVDDVACAGAQPLFMLDYIATERLDPGVVAQLVTSIAAGCRMAGCALVGGETAEHRGLLVPGALDVAGFCVGVVERDDLLDGTASRVGDMIVGIGATGLHANGYSLVRSVVAEHRLDLHAPYSELAARTIGPGSAGEPGLPTPDGTLADVLLEPTPIFSPALLGLRAELRRSGADIHGLAHITGGGLPANVPRALAEDQGARLDPERWPVPSVVECFGILGGLTPPEMRAVFNGGLGMVLVLDRDAADAAVTILARHGLAAWVVGEVIEARSGPRYQEAAALNGARQ